MKNEIRVLHFTTHNEDCGIGKYQEQFLLSMGIGGGIYNEVFPYSPNKTKNMSHDEMSKVVNELKIKLKEFDLLHVQHEFSFYKHDELSRIINAAKEIGKKVVVTVHTAPDAQYQEPSMVGIGIRSLVRYAKMTKNAAHFTRVYITPLHKADLILVHNDAAKQNLVKHGVDVHKIKRISMPVPVLSDKVTVSDEISKALSRKKGDVICASVGFLSRMKGIDHSIKSLKYLPSNYKLAIIGGIHPNGGNEELLDQLCDLIVQLDLTERVYITGYVDDDKQLNALIRECNICVYPYDPSYYSYVSSAALNNALANHKPAVVYPTKSFTELNEGGETVAITKSPNYYELSRSIKSLDIEKYGAYSKAHASSFSYTNESSKLVAIYKELTT